MLRYKQSSEEQVCSRFHNPNKITNERYHDVNGINLFQSKHMSDSEVKNAEEIKQYVCANLPNVEVKDEHKVA